MKRLQLLVILWFLGCAVQGWASSPTITGLTPGSGAPGASVEIDGSGFGGSTGTVTFNGQSASISSWSDGKVVAVVPGNATSGYVVVTAGGAASNGVNFVVNAPGPVYSAGVTVQIAAGSGGPLEVVSPGVSVQQMQPLAVPSAALSTGIAPGINSLSANAAALGTALTIHGLNFGSSQGTASQVSINGILGSPTSWSSASITVPVPTGASTNGNVVVTVRGMNSNGAAFTVIPGVSNVSPGSGDPGTQVTLTGTNFGSLQGNGGVQFNGTAATIINWSDGAITAYVPVGASTGNVVVTSNGGLSSNGFGFTVTDNLAITQFSPVLGPVGTTVTVTGGGFGASQGQNTISFDQVPATVVSWSDNQIQATVPNASVTGPIVVNVNASNAVSAAPFVVDSTVEVTDSLGNNSFYSSAIIGGTWQGTVVTGSGCSSCTLRGNSESTYDNSGNLHTYTDPLGHVTTYTYDANNNMASQSIPLNTTTTVTTSYTYNSFGEVLTADDPLGHVTTNTYDSNGNLLTVTTPAPNGNTAASVTQFAYNTLGELTQITDPLNNMTKLAYTPVGLISTITDAQQNVTTYQYDSHGNRTAVIDAQQNTTSFTYDAMDRLTTITYPDHTTASFGYDYRGRRTTVTDQNGKTTTYAYDDADRLTSVTDAAGHVTQYSYDTENNLLSITDANNNVTQFAYDAFGRVTQTTFPSTLVETYAYDANNNLNSKTDRKGQAILYVYDALNRLTFKDYPDSTAVEYVYDLAGKVTQVNDPTGTYGFAYDNMGRLIGTTTQYTFLPSLTFTNAYGYDANSNRTSFAAPDGSTNAYQFDSLNRLSTLTNSLTGQFTFGYDSLSRRTSLARPNGLSTSYSYDSLSRLLSVLHQTGTNTLDGASYTYDSAGNRMSKTNQLNGVTEQYTYDAIYQLLQASQGSTTTESYTYDAVGNKLSSLTVPQWNYNASNELTSNSAVSFAYDNNGNTVNKTVSSGVTAYGWDFENRMTSSVVPNGTVTFRYDPFGRRIQKAVTQGSTTTTTTNYLYDGANSVTEVDQSGNLLARHTQGAGIDEPLAEIRSGTASYYEQDGLGSVTSLSTSTGSLSDTYVYKPFGDVAASTGNTVNPFQYAGRDYDPETGLRYYRARYYDSSFGRFLDEDPIRFRSGMNFYDYVHNNPIGWNDPSGMIHQAWNEPPFDGRLHDDPGAGLEALCTKGRNIQQDIAWLKHSIQVRWEEIGSLGKDADAGHQDRLAAELFTLAHCESECDKDKKPNPETEPFNVPDTWLKRVDTWLQDRWDELKGALKRGPQGPAPGPVPGPNPIPVFP